MGLLLRQQAFSLMHVPPQQRCPAAQQLLPQHSPAQQVSPQHFPDGQHVPLQQVWPFGQQTPLQHC
jgi:hypothetical protein